MINSGSFTIYIVFIGISAESSRNIQGGLQILRSEVNNFIRQLKQKNDLCMDELPIGSPFSCQEHKELGLCDTLQQQYCQRSCQRCEEELQQMQNGGVCDDKFFPGTQDCRIVLKQNLCQNSSIKGKYCNKSCGFCGNYTAPAVEAIISPSQEPPNDCEDVGAFYCDILALLSLKESVTKGQSVLHTWGGDAPCSWKYVECNYVDGQNQRVSQLSLEFDDNDYLAKTMVGTLPAQLSYLRYLERFYIQNQKFSGSLAQEYSVLNKLVFFSVASNEFTGSLPKQYSTWNLLQEFTVSLNNYLSKDLPPEYSTWTALKEGRFPQNRFYGTLPKQYSVWSKIQLFDIDLNLQYGSIPVDYSVWEDCEEISLSMNLFTGELPKEYSNMTNLKAFYAFDNFVTGQLPHEYSEWKNLDIFVMYNNELSGNIPEVYSEWEKMKNFQVYFNELTGTLPKQFSVMRFLFRFLSYGNNISKTIPEEWSDFSYVAHINV